MGAFSKEIVRQVTRELMPQDGRESGIIRQAQDVLVELEQGLPERAIRMLENRGRSIGEHRQQIDSLILTLQE